MMYIGTRSAAIRPRRVLLTTAQISNISLRMNMSSDAKGNQWLIKFSKGTERIADAICHKNPVTAIIIAPDRSTDTRVGY